MNWEIGRFVSNVDHHAISLVYIHVIPASLSTLAIQVTVTIQVMR